LEPITQETVQDRFLVEQLEWDQSFRQAGKRALIGAGGDPGLVNIMARDAADQLDVVDAIRIKDYGIVEADEPVALWSMTIFLEDSAEPAPYWENGEYKWAAPFTGEEEYYFPPPLDHRGTVFYHCHEEPVTLPHFIGKPVGYCDFKLGDPNMETWRFLIEGLGMMNDEPIEVGGQQVVPRDVLYRLIPKTLSPGACIEMVEQGRLMSRLQLAVDVEGSRDGERRRHKLWTASPDVVEACRRIPGSNDVSWITSVPASVLALMLLRGQIHHEGVFPCEVLDPDERESFFAAIAEWGITIHREVTSGE
jgi:saccharopine dehydrogenase-like NADP-dependent oxidoreductase